MIMIKKIIYTIVLTLLMVFCHSFEVKAQCGDELTDVCHAKLGNSRFIRSFHIQHTETKSATPRVAKFEVILNRGTTYRIFSCNDKTKPGEVIISLYRGDQLISTSYDINSRRHFPFIEYPVGMSGRYQLHFYFEDDKEGCAVGMLSIVN